MVIVGMFLGYKLHDSDHHISLIESLNSSDEEGLQIGRIEEIIRFVENKYVDDIDEDGLVEDLISQVIEKLDPHSVYIPPEKLNQINTEMSGAYIGLGIETSFIEDTVRVMHVFDESPAQKAGIKVRDALISIDDSIVVNNELSFDDIRKLLKRDKGKEVSLTLKRNDELLELSLATDEISVSSVDASRMLTDDIGYIRISKFTSKTYREFATTLEDLYENKGLKKLVIDVRDNPGGYLPEATNILSQLFKEKGRMLVYTEGKNQKKAEYKTTGKPFFNIGDIAVLINESSASGSEILAGAIQDWDRGVVIGRRSYGKGLVQEQYELSNGGAIRLTIARYYTASGRSIQKDFSEREEYLNEIDTRIRNGEHLYGTFADSMKTEFKSKILKRKLIAEGGIYPDVFVPEDSLWYDPRFNKLVPHIESFAYYNEFDLLQGYENVTDFSQNFRLSVAQKNAFYSYLTDKKDGVTEDFLDTFENYLFEELQLNLAQMRYGKAGKVALLIHLDRDINEALKILQSSDVMAELKLMSEEN